MLKFLRGALCVWAAIVGSVVGAGFASGEEVLSFFAVYGASALSAAVLAGALLGMLGGRLMHVAQSRGASSHAAVLRLLFGSYAPYAEVMLALFWLVSLAVMLAGAGALCRPYVPPALSTAVLALVLLFLSVRGARAVLSANLVITPLVLAMLCGALVYSLVWHQASLSALVPAPSESVGVRALLSSLLYVSYNLVLCMPALTALPVLSKRAVRLGAAGAGLTLCFLLAALVAVVSLHYEESIAARLPMLTVSAMQHDACFALYGAVLVLAMVTSASSALLGTSQMLAPYVHAPLMQSASVLTAALLIGQVGFSLLVDTLLPALGVTALIFTLRLCCPVRAGKGRH